MRKMLSKMATAMLVAVGAVGAVQAENGSENLMNFHVRQQAVANQQADLDSVQRSVQLVKENPTAAGPMVEERAQSTQETSTTHLSPIQQDRELYGSGK